MKELLEGFNLWGYWNPPYLVWPERHCWGSPPREQGSLEWWGLGMMMMMRSQAGELRLRKGWPLPIGYESCGGAAEVVRSSAGLAG